MSPVLDVDLTEAQEFEPIDEGVYLCEVTDIDGPEQGPKAAYLEVQYTIVEGEHAGRKLFDNVVIEGKGAGFFIDFWKKVVGEKLDVGDVVAVDTDNALGEAVECHVGVEDRPEEFGGGERNVVRRLVAVD